MVEEILSRQLRKEYPQMVEIRRHLHRHPELSFHEKETARFIENYYKELKVPVRSKVGNGGVVAVIKGKLPGKTTALRADFDALPIQDEKEVPYKSTVKGVMHACGHDGHTALLLVLTKVLKSMENQLEGTYVMIHQHAEEIAPGGAKAMIADGCLDDVDLIIGTHLWAPYPTGTVYCGTGPVTAAADRFMMTIHGKGGHGAEPHHAQDPLVTSSLIVGALQTIASRRINPMEAAVVTVGKFQSGDAFNIIPDTAYLEGTVRTFNEGTQQKIKSEIKRIAEGICLTSGCTLDFDYRKGYPPTVNHEFATNLVERTARDLLQKDQVKSFHPMMIGEDYSYYLQQIEGTFFLTGAAPENITHPPYPHHHPLFDFNEKAMLIAANLLGIAAIRHNRSAYEKGSF